MNWYHVKALYNAEDSIRDISSAAREAGLSDLSLAAEHTVAGIIQTRAKILAVMAR